MLARDALFRVCDALLALNLSPVDIATFGRRAEVDYAGVQVGIMDQMASALAEPDRRVLGIGGLSIGLYTVGIAAALGARVEYLDTDHDRCAIAERFGAQVTEAASMPSGTDPYPVVVNTSAEADKLLPDRDAWHDPAA